MQISGSPFASDGGTAPYNPMMHPISSSSPSPPAPTSFQLLAGDTSTVPVTVNPSSIEPAKRKRGRPRKYATEGSGNSGIISSPPPPPPTSSFHVDGVGFSSLTPPQRAEDAAAAAAVSAEKRGRGRPRGSGRKQREADLGSAAAGAGFRPHTITIKAGEDVLARLMAFSQSTSQAVCVLSANGSISNVTLRQAETSGGTVTYEGRFEILSLSGSFLLSESGGQRSRTGGLSVTLAGSDGHVLGGGVAGLLIAAATVQVIVGSFSIEGQKQLKPGHSDTTMPVSGASAAKSPPSLGTLSESSDEPLSPHDQFVETSNNNPSGVANLSWN